MTRRETPDETIFGDMGVVLLGAIVACYVLAHVAWWGYSRGFRP